MQTFSLETFRQSYRMRHEPEKFVYAANVLWMMMLACSSLAIVASVGYGAWQFFAPPETTPTTLAEVGISGFNQKQLSAVVEFYEKRQAVFEAMMSE